MNKNGTTTGAPTREDGIGPGANEANATKNPDVIEENADKSNDGTEVNVPGPKTTNPEDVILPGITAPPTIPSGHKRLRETTGNPDDSPLLKTTKFVREHAAAVAGDASNRNAFEALFSGRSYSDKAMKNFTRR